VGRPLDEVKVVDSTHEEIDVIFGDIDTLKFRSSMTLFAQVAGDSSVFADALRKYFGGQADQRTLDRR